MDKEEKKLVRGNWHIYKKEKKKVARLAKVRGMSESEFIRHMINSYV